MGSLVLMWREQGETRLFYGLPVRSCTVSMACLCFPVACRGLGKLDVVDNGGFISTNIQRHFVCDPARTKPDLCTPFLALEFQTNGQSTFPLSSSRRFHMGSFIMSRVVRSHC